MEGLYHITAVLAIDPGYPTHSNCTIPHISDQFNLWLLLSLMRIQVTSIISIKREFKQNQKHQVRIEQTCREAKVNGIKTNLEDMHRFVVQGRGAPCGHRLRVAWPLGAVLNLLNISNHHSKKDWHLLSSRTNEPGKKYVYRYHGTNEHQVSSSSCRNQNTRKKEEHEEQEKWDLQDLCWEYWDHVGIGV
ncbi:predicted protein [Lichtheimia corymbifera JMRC:FSU:9682]|uniref:Uncharacterized protein n=1 Tax=Lichtheimia corymbifera JMRC:FSU:9682 TaxID=1263082 RepID=A0A068SFE3_9FUNG|nr:predicted protein [Lichtheimia corymbifera JMRC:FSU:9682]CDH61434.1 predicted protein [Lichtheimia corymbifera JMRC:FSU:9682]